MSKQENVNKSSDFTFSDLTQKNSPILRVALALQTCYENNALNNCFFDLLFLQFFFD